MTPSKTVVLKPGKEKAIKGKHPWIFSGAVLKRPSLEKGEIAFVESAHGEFLGLAYFHPKTSIAGRMISFSEKDPIKAIKNSIDSALNLREHFFGNNTTAYRLINGEGDNLPGLIVDRYDNTLVLQIATVGMELLKPQIVEILKEKLKIKAIFEKSTSPSRKEEGLLPTEGALFGKIDEEILVLENGLKFLVNIRNGQKTGFFLDQRNMRDLVQKLSHQKKVLNAFSYTGGFSVYALAGGATSVDSIDISKEATTLSHKNCLLNGFNEASFHEYTEDVFHFLRENPLDYDLIILDPPAFAKKSSDVIQACRGYKDINRLALKKMRKNSILITSSCSHFVDEKLFSQVLFQAALEANRNVRIIGKHQMAVDHPVSLYHPEGEYLKSLVLFVDG